MRGKTPSRASRLIFSRNITSCIRYGCEALRLPALEPLSLNVSATKWPPLAAVLKIGCESAGSHRVQTCVGASGSRGNNVRATRRNIHVRKIVTMQKSRFVPRDFDEIRSHVRIFQHEMVVVLVAHENSVSVAAEDGDGACAGARAWATKGMTEKSRAAKR